MVTSPDSARNCIHLREAVLDAANSREVVAEREVPGVGRGEPDLVDRIPVNLSGERSDDVAIVAVAAAGEGRSEYNNDPASPAYSS